MYDFDPSAQTDFEQRHIPVPIGDISLIREPIDQQPALAGDIPLPPPADRGIEATTAPLQLGGLTAAEVDLDIAPEAVTGNHLEPQQSSDRHAPHPIEQNTRTTPPELDAGPESSHDAAGPPDEPPGDGPPPPETPFPSDDDGSDKHEARVVSPLGFRQVFDGTQPDIPLPEQKEAGGLFSDYVESHLRDRRPATSSNLTHRRTLDEGQPRVDTSVSSEDSPGGKCTQRVAVRVYGDSGSIREAAEYTLGSDGVVRRTDYVPPSKEERHMAFESWKGAGRLLPREGMSEEEAHAFQERLKAQLNQIAAGQELKEQLGLRNQPVGLREIRALLSLLRGDVK